MIIVRSAFLAGVLSTALLAQWPKFTTPGVPRTPDGKVDLTAPAPRTADGHPDFSGIWEVYRERRTPPPASSAGAPGLAPVRPNESQFFNIGVGLKEPIPFTPWAAALRKSRASENNKDNPDAHCLPIGLTQLHMHPQPRKIVQTPNLIVIIYEANSGLRQIFLDGRPLPKDPDPWWYGYSVGKWDGDTLVVETTGFRDDVWLDVEGTPLTSSGKTIERIRRPNFGTLETEMTIEDPKAYTKPWTVNFRHRIMVDTELIEFVCQENEQDAAHYVAK
jgi:hypothetical protein